MDKYYAIRSRELSFGYESRFVIVDSKTQQVLDDANGAGYPSYDAAMSGYRAKQRRRLFQRKK